MCCYRYPPLLNLLLALSLSTAICTPSLAGDMALLSIGPRIGFGEKIPLMGKEQKYYFHLYDVAAIIKLPWSWPLGESTWSLETRLITSAGLLTAAGESGLMMTVVPELALSGCTTTTGAAKPSNGNAGAAKGATAKPGTLDFEAPDLAERWNLFTSFGVPVVVDSLGSPDEIVAAAGPPAF